jgi:hypothetical protein
MPSWQRKTIGETALKALRGWKGPVPRFILWRVAYLAALSRGRNAERVETLATLLELREEQRRRPGS